MPKKIQGEWELPDALIDALTPETTEVADTMKAAAVLYWSSTHKLSRRRGAELLQMPYRAFLDLMAAHRVPSIDSEAGWLDREQRLCEGNRGATSPGCRRSRLVVSSSTSRRRITPSCCHIMFRPS